MLPNLTILEIFITQNDKSTGKHRTKRSFASRKKFTTKRSDNIITMALFFHVPNKDTCIKEIIYMTVKRVFKYLSYGPC
jgi:hypothetical protein